MSRCCRRSATKSRLVRAYLEHFLRDAENTDAFSQFLQTRLSATRLCRNEVVVRHRPRRASGTRCCRRHSDKRFATPSKLRLAADNPKRFAADEPTQLKVDVKNVPELVVRIYEINTQSYYRTHDKPIDTDIDLDGLVATHEKKLTFNQPAVERHRETIDLPEISGRGVWIVDLVGKGVRARRWSVAVRLITSIHRCQRDGLHDH